MIGFSAANSGCRPRGCADTITRPPGRYFLTICTKNKIPWFGRIRNGFVCLSDAGAVAYDEWIMTEHIRSNITLDAFVIMPNHIHGIICINDDDSNAEIISHAVVETHRRCVSTEIGLLIPSPRRQPGSLGSIVAQYKSVCTKRIRDMGYGDFGWQTRYYDHILRDQNAVDRVRAYIRDNPWKWTCDHLQ